MAPFEDLFPTFLRKCAELHDLLQLVAYLLFIVGTILFVLHGFSAKRLTLHLVRILTLTALLVMLPRWGNQVQAIVQASILDGLGIDPAHVQDQYNALLVVKRDTGVERSWWDKPWLSPQLPAHVGERSGPDLGRRSQRRRNGCVQRRWDWAAQTTLNRITRLRPTAPTHLPRNPQPCYDGHGE